MRGHSPGAYVTYVTYVTYVAYLACGARRVEELEAAEVVGGEHEAAVVGAVGCVDVATIGAVWPHTEHRKAEHAWL
jgi:hypothetical protein